MAATESSLSDFLTSLKLPEYAANFGQRGLDTLEACLDVDDSFLQDIGIVKLGHRKRILTELEKARNCDSDDLKTLSSTDSSENLIDLCSDTNGVTTSSPPTAAEKPADAEDWKLNKTDHEKPPPIPPKAVPKSQSLKDVKPPRPKPPVRYGSAKDPSKQSLADASIKPLSRPEIPPRVDLGERDGVSDGSKSGNVVSDGEGKKSESKDATGTDQVSEQEVEMAPPLPPKRQERGSKELLTALDSDETVTDTPVQDNKGDTSAPHHVDQSIVESGIHVSPLDELVDENKPFDRTVKSFSGVETRPKIAPRPKCATGGSVKPRRPPRLPPVGSTSSDDGSSPRSVKSPPRIPTVENTSGSEGYSPLSVISPKAPPVGDESNSSPRLSPDEAKDSGNQAVIPLVEVSGFDAFGQAISQDLKQDNDSGIASIPPQPDEESDSDESQENGLDSNGNADTMDSMTGDFPEDVKLISLRRDKKLFDAAVAPNKGLRETRISRMSFINQRCGFLDKRGGEKGTKPFKRRWVVFDGNDLRYYKPSDKETKSESLQIVPVFRMQDVEIVKGAKRPQFNLKTPNRTFVFSHEDYNEIIMWSQVLMQAILYRRQSNDIDTMFGGSFADPDMEGWLKKQGHNVVGDWKDRYVAVKGSKVAYYHSFGDYKDDMPINTIDMTIATVKLDVGKHRLQLVTPQKEFWFETENHSHLETWKVAFDTAIQVGLGDPAVLDQIRQNPSNTFCADCGKKNPVWASVNLCVVVCARCIGFHRNLGARISKARSILMDVKVWTKELIKLFKDFGNANANKLWEDKLPTDDKITADASKDSRCEFIIAKYKEKRYFGWSPFYGNPDELGQALRQNVRTDNILETLRLLICGVDVYYVEPDAEDQRTPYELATDAHKETQMELLRQFYGNLGPNERENITCPSPEPERASPTQDQNEPVQPNWEKEGYLLKRGPKNSEPWKRRKFFLKERTLCYDREVKGEEFEVIDLRKMVSVQLGQNENDPATINIQLSTSRIYYLKGETVKDAESWYQAIRNKQAFGVPIQCQEVNCNNVPYVVMKCVDYIDSFGLEQEGVYRLNGSQVTIKKLVQLFNQDARIVHLTRDEYPIVHDIAGVLKLYLRELPCPLIDEELYDELADNCSEANHYTKLYKMKDLIARLHEINRCTLRCLVLHLDKIVRNEGKNLMKMENIVTIFGPIVMSRGKTLDQAYLTREFAVMNDLLTYNQWLFDVDDKELEKDQQIENALLKIKMAEGMKEKISTGVKIDDLQQTIYVNSLDDSCMVKINSKSSASDVCWYVVNFKGLPLDANWALFEMINDCELERPLQSREFILPLVMDGGKGYTLMMKPNYVAEMTAPHQNSDLGMKGNLHVKKNDSGWKKNQYLEVRTGTLVVFAKKGGSEVEKLQIHEISVYIGIEKKKKPPGKFGVTLKAGQETRCLCTDDETSMNKWVAVLLTIRYPGGIWTKLQAPEVTSPTLAQQSRPTSNYWGRQSTYLRPSGASLSVLKELQFKKSRLKTVK